MEKYRVTENGQIISNRLNRPMKLQVHKNGYYNVQLQLDGYHKMKYVHRLVAEKFIPNPHNKPEVNHINKDKLDNRVENLEWVTSAENLRHSAKLDNACIVVIKEAFHSGHKQQSIANYFGITQGHVSNVIANRRW